MIGVKEGSTTLPFIHLFKTPQKYYVYDVNTNKIVEISEGLYRCFQQNEFESNDFSDEISSLKEIGMLKTNTLQHISHPMSTDIGIKLERGLKSIVLQLTQNCNLRCSYCPYSQVNSINRKHNNFSMSWKNAKKSIDFLYNHSIDADSVNLAFYGGEPLLNFEILKKSVEYYNVIFKGKKRRLSITTNATLLTKEVCEFLELHDFNVLLSLDGIKEINDKNRKFQFGDQSVFDLVMKNLNRIREENKKLFEKITINVVMDPMFPFELYKNLIKNYDLFRHVAIRSTIVDDSGSDNKSIFSDEFIYQHQYHQFLVLLQVVKRFDLKNELLIINNALENAMSLIDDQIEQFDLGEKNAPSGQCLPGVHRLMIDTHGRFLPCEKVNETLTDNIIGNLNDGFYLSKINQILNFSSFTSDECKGCFAFRECFACIKMCNHNFTESQADKLKQCSVIRGDIHMKMMKRQIIKEVLSKSLEIEGNYYAKA